MDWVGHYPVEKINDVLDFIEEIIHDSKIETITTDAINRIIQNKNLILFLKKKFKSPIPHSLLLKKIFLQFPLYSINRDLLLKIVLLFINSIKRQLIIKSCNCLRSNLKNTVSLCYIHNVRTNTVQHIRGTKNYLFLLDLIVFSGIHSGDKLQFRISESNLLRIFPKMNITLLPTWHNIVGHFLPVEISQEKRCQAVRLVIENKKVLSNIRQLNKKIERSLECHYN